MKISLIMATYGRSQEIILFLGSLIQQSYKDFELLIIDQNEDDRVVKIYEEYKNKLNIKYYHNQIKGISINRNIGLSHISGDIVAFPDDDCTYETDTLEKAVSFFEKNTDYSFYTCNTMDKNSNGTIIKTKSTDTDVSVFNFMSVSISITIFVRSIVIKPFKFDEQLGAGTHFGSGEESDLILFLLKQKNNGRYHANDYIYHPANIETAEKAFQYGKGYGAIHKKAIVEYRFYMFFISFMLTLFKETVKMCIYPHSVERVSTMRGRIYGFLHYKRTR